MIGCLWTRVRKQPIIALYFEFETVLKFYNLGARSFDKSVKFKNNFLYFNHSCWVLNCLNIRDGSFEHPKQMLKLTNKTRGPEGPEALTWSL